MPGWMQTDITNEINALEAPRADGVDARLPRFTKTTSSSANLKIHLDHFPADYVSAIAYTTSPSTSANMYVSAEDEWKVTPKGGYRVKYCGHTDYAGSCYQLKAVIAHEMGHVFRLDHAKPTSYTIMQGIDPAGEAYKDCDTAALQGKYGLLSPFSRFSPCVPPLPTKVALSASASVWYGSSVTVSATLKVGPLAIYGQNIPAEYWGLDSNNNYKTAPDRTDQWNTSGLANQTLSRSGTVVLYSTAGQSYGQMTSAGNGTYYLTVTSLKKTTSFYAVFTSSASDVLSSPSSYGTDVPSVTVNVLRAPTSLRVTLVDYSTMRFSVTWSLGYSPDAITVTRTASGTSPVLATLAGTARQYYDNNVPRQSTVTWKVCSVVSGVSSCSWATTNTP
jgi:hypothetical protein